MTIFCFWSLGLGWSQSGFFKALIMPAGQRRVPDMLLSLKILSSDGLITTSLQNSVLKISISFFVKFSKNSKILKYPGAALVYFSKPIIVVPAKNHQRKSLIQPNSKRKPKSRSLLKSAKDKTLQSGLYKKQKSN